MVNFHPKFHHPQVIFTSENSTIIHVTAKARTFESFLTSLFKSYQTANSVCFTRFLPHCIYSTHGGPQDLPKTQVGSHHNLPWLPVTLRIKPKIRFGTQDKAWLLDSLPVHLPSLFSNHTGLPAGPQHTMHFPTL